MVGKSTRMVSEHVHSWGHHDVPECTVPRVVGEPHVVQVSSMALCDSATCYSLLGMTDDAIHCWHEDSCPNVPSGGCINPSTQQHPPSDTSGCH